MLTVLLTTLVQSPVWGLMRVNEEYTAAGHRSLWVASEHQATLHSTVLPVYTNPVHLCKNNMDQLCVMRVSSNSMNLLPYTCC